jgi:hypothetical protein
VNVWKAYSYTSEETTEIEEEEIVKDIMVAHNSIINNPDSWEKYSA